MHRVVPSILDAWRAAEREHATLPRDAPLSLRLAARIALLQDAYRLATSTGAERDTVVRFLEEHELSDVVSDAA